MIYHLVITKKDHKISIKEDINKDKLMNKLNKKYSDKKYHAKVIGIPKIKLGLNLYKKGEYYKTIIGVDNTLYYMVNVDNFSPGIIPDPMRIEILPQLFIEGMLDPDIEEYDKNHNEMFFDHRYDNKEIKEG
jgi:hypothetical protein